MILLNERKISLDKVRANLNFPWDWKRICRQQVNISMEFVDEFKDMPLDWKMLSWIMDFFVIITRPHYPWDWAKASYGIGDKRLLGAYNDPEIRDLINWRGVSESEHVSMDFIVAHPELPWDPIGLLKNAHLTLDYYLNMPNKPANMVEYLWENYWHDMDLDDDGKREWNDFVFCVVGESPFIHPIGDEDVDML